MWGHNNDYDNYWPEYESEYRPVPGWHGQRRHRMDLTLPGPYGGGPRRPFRPDLMSTPHAAPRPLAPPFRPRGPIPQERPNPEKLYQDFNGSYFSLPAFESALCNLQTRRGRRRSRWNIKHRLSSVKYPGARRYYTVSVFLEWIKKYKEVNCVI